MNPLIYFLGGNANPTVTDDDLRKAGLGYAVPEQGILSRRTEKGPGEKSGVLCADSRCVAGDLTYVPDQQVWKRIPGTENWCGYWKDRKPGPDDLKRNRLYAGQAVTLLDGQEWIIPRCYAFFPDRPMTLPQVYDLDDEGQIIARPHDRFRSLCEQTLRWFQHYTGRLPDEQKMTVLETIDLAVQAMAVNYRVGKVEIIGLLGLWGSDEHGLVIRAMIDADEIDAWVDAEMKKQAGGDGAGGSDGGEPRPS